MVAGHSKVAAIFPTHTANHEAEVGHLVRLDQILTAGYVKHEERPAYHCSLLARLYVCRSLYSACRSHSALNHSLPARSIFSVKERI